MTTSVLQFFYRRRRVIVATIFCFVWLMPFAVHAQGTGAVNSDNFGLQPIGNTGLFGTDDIRVIVARIINIALGLLGVVALGLVLYAGFVIMTAGGNEEKVAEGKKILVNAVIGLALVWMVNWARCLVGA